MVAFNEHFNSFSPDELDPESRSSKVISSAFGSNSGIMKLDKGFLWKLLKTPLYKKLVESQEYLEKYELNNLSYKAKYLSTPTLIKKMIYFSRVSAEILLRRVNFFEVERNESDKSLLGSFLEQPKLDLKDITGMMVDILMAAIDTVRVHNCRTIPIHTYIYTIFSSFLPHFAILLPRYHKIFMVSI